MAQTTYHEFKEYGLAVVTGDTLMVEGIPKSTFKNCDHFTEQNFDTKFSKIVRKNHLDALKEHKLLMARMRIAQKNPEFAYQNAHLNDFISLAETIFSCITDSTFTLKKHGRVIMLPVPLYEKIEQLVAHFNPHITKDNPDYYTNTSAMLIEKQYILIRQRTLDSSMLITLIHEIGHMITPGSSNPKKLEFYAYCMEYLGLAIFNHEYQKVFPGAIPIKSHASAGLKSKIHAAAFKEATEYVKSILAKPP